MTYLLIAEKPKVARKLAHALGDPDTTKKGKVSYHEVETKQGRVLIASAVGHVYTLEQKTSGRDYPEFDIEWKPSHVVDDDNQYMKNYIDVIKELKDRADVYVNACDYDVEGCLHPTEQVVIKRGDTVEIRTVSNLIDTVLANKEVEEEDGFEYCSTDLEIVGVDDWEAGFRTVNKVMRRPADDTYLEIRTTYGRKIKVSKNHPMLVADESGIVTKRADQLTENDFLLVNKRLPNNASLQTLDLIDRLDDIYVHGFKEDMDIMPAEMCKHVDKTRKQCLNYRFHDRMPKHIFLELEPYLGVSRDNLTVSSPRGSTRLPARLELTEELGRIIGLYLAEGCIDTSGFIGYYFGPEEGELVDEVQAFLRSIGTEGKRRQREVQSGAFGDAECFEVGTKSRVLRNLFTTLQLGRQSGSKRLPEWILSAPEAFQWGVITGYWDGDGSLFIESKNGRATASAGSISRGLLADLFYLLQTKGVNASLHDNPKQGNTILTVGRKPEVTKIATQSKARKEVMAGLEEKQPQPGHNRLEMVPAALAQRQEIGEKYTQNQAMNTRFAVSSIESWEPEMENYPDGDTGFLQILSIEEKEADCDYFYDFETETGNFMHGNGVITHNSTIGRNMIHFACNVSDEKIKRMHFSTLTQGDLRDAFASLEEFDKGQTYAGLTRHKLDWYFGINLSRALMSAVKTQNRFQVLSTGRVQGPTLKIVVDREREIEAFDPEPYWQLFFHGPDDFSAQYEEEKIWEEDTATQIHEECVGHDGDVTDVEKRRYKHWQPNPFNLTDLQTAAYKQFNYRPKQTQQLAQQLYEQGVISYPRTSSQKLPPKIGYKNILNKLKKRSKYEDKAKTVLGKDKVYPNQGKKEDDAHPAIHPTGLKPKNLSKKQKNLYDLIVKRFFATFGDPAIRQSVKITLDVNGYLFHAKAKRTVERNWHNLYEPYVRIKEEAVPAAEEGETIPQEELELVEKETQPPKRYTQSSLVNKMEDVGIGTKATRSNTVSALYNRNYIEHDPIEATALGKGVVSALEENCPRILSAELTREFEESMEKIRNGDAAPDTILSKAEEELTGILADFKEHEPEVGEQLVDALDTTRKQQNTLGECPECGEDLVIRKSGDSRFVGCEGYPDCENTYPLPGYGKIESTDETCDDCGTPYVKVIRKGKKPWKMCLVYECGKDEE